ncbi:hypothetical protein GCM10007977_058870 [Dactylosporangium sucinum]|uniref:Uncharacterized protein n=1 Tax=Dactylosporangium sucinum TaxID=1424081 RepID=A0A917U1A7_9ACTN|nr:hypothetical protein GCM10007977_058870 [Dactylosporangium sucinum]
MAVREQDRGRLQPVLGEHLVEPVGDADARVDHHALLAGGRGDDKAVRPEHLGGKAGDEHAALLPVDVLNPAAEDLVNPIRRSGTANRDRAATRIPGSTRTLWRACDVAPKCIFLEGSTGGFQ